MQHNWDLATPYCTRCGVQKGWHAEECLATANVVGFVHHLAKRRATVRDSRTVESGEGKIIVEAFPREPA